MNDSASDFFAVVVGVGEYLHSDLASLDATLTDARDLRAVLVDPRMCRYPPEQVELLIGADATLEGFRKSLSNLVTRVTAASTVLIYFSGHGGRLSYAPTLDSYLCMRYTDPTRLNESALSSTEFGEALRRIRSGRLVVILDACYAAGAASLKGPMTSNAPWVEGFSDEAIVGLSKGKGRVVIASSSALQPSYVREQGDKSLFTYHLLQALCGGAGVRRDGYIHILDVFHYVSEAVRSQTQTQTPILKADDLDSNFPIALDQVGNQPITSIGAVGVLATSSVIDAAPLTPIDTIRERIIAEPLSGSEALSRYLATLNGAGGLRDEIDVIRSQLQMAQREIELYQSDRARVTRSRLVYLLLDRCTRVGRSDTSVSETSAPLQPITPNQPGATVAPSAETNTAAKPTFHISISAGRDVVNPQVADKITNVQNNFNSSPTRNLQPEQVERLQKDPAQDKH